MEGGCFNTKKVKFTPLNCFCYSLPAQIHARPPTETPDLVVQVGSFSTSLWGVVKTGRSDGRNAKALCKKRTKTAAQSSGSRTKGRK